MSVGVTLITPDLPPLSNAEKLAVAMLNSGVKAWQIAQHIHCDASIVSRHKTGKQKLTEKELTKYLEAIDQILN